MKTIKTFSKFIELKEDLMDDLKNLGFEHLKGWIIDYSAISGPDYAHDAIVILIAKDEDAAIDLVSDGFDIPEESFKKEKTLEETVENVLNSKYFTNEGWKIQLNEIEYHEVVKTRKSGAYTELYNSESPYEDPIELKENAKKLIKDLIG